METDGRLPAKAARELPNRSFSREEAVLRLGLLVAQGVEPALELWKRMGFDESEFHTSYVTPLNIATIEDDLYDSMDFSVALLIGFCHAVVPEMKNSKKPHTELAPLFLERLTAIFPENTAKRLYRYTLVRIPEIAAPEFPERMRLHAERVRLAFARLSAKAPGGWEPSRPRVPGTETMLFSCPKCGTKKRCDKNTKRFYCKGLGCDFRSERFSFAAENPFGA